jgi:hypothetical protein
MKPWAAENRFPQVLRLPFPIRYSASVLPLYLFLRCRSCLKPRRKVRKRPFVPFHRQVSYFQNYPGDYDYPCFESHPVSFFCVLRAGPCDSRKVFQFPSQSPCQLVQGMGMAARSRLQQPVALGFAGYAVHYAAESYAVVVVSWGVDFSLQRYYVAPEPSPWVIPLSLGWLRQQAFLPYAHQRWRPIGF